VQSEFVFSLGRYSFTITSFELLAACAILLAASALLLLLSRRNRVVVQRSLLTDELMAHLSRIADALETQAARGPDHSVAEAIRRMDERLQTSLAPPPKPNTETRTIPYSMFGREIQPAK
jgi:hypothetical protein